jgi:hypothetical protein
MNNIKITPQLNQMLRHTEAGEPANFRKYGREIFNQIEQTEPKNPLFARTLSPNDFTRVSAFAAKSYVAPEASTEQFSSENFNHLNKNALEQESRMLGQTQVPKKKTRDSNIIDQRFGASEGNFMRQLTREEMMSEQKHQEKAIKKVNLKHIQGNNIIA